ncbi:MAG TPA: TatD family hydrolase [Polyangia bacterium]|jgi:hydrolase, TatD family|nr:TatD family hydrolase [Polyangia bacterium]
MVPIVDSHCHLDFDDFAQDLPAVLDRARQAGLQAMICIGSGADLATAQRAADLAAREPDVFAAVGVHPHDAAKLEDDWWPVLDELARAPRVVGVGETGLDYFYDRSPRETQAEVFRKFLALSRSTGRPFICHVRDAHEDALAILRAESPSEAGGVVHCFSGNLDHARGYLDLGLDLSFSGILTFKNADEIRRVAAFAPLGSILVETDAPYLAPMPLRGKRNEPALVVKTLEALALVRGIPFSRAAEATAQNAQRRFALPDFGAPAGGTILVPPAG